MENAEELRQLNFWRLEKLSSIAFPPALGIGDDGKRQQPDLKTQDLVRRIIHDENKLMGVYDLPPSEGHDGSAGHAAATEEDLPDAILVTEIDEERLRAAMARSARNEPISVDDQPPAGYIAPGSTRSTMHPTARWTNRTAPTAIHPRRCVVDLARILAGAVKPS